MFMSLPAKEVICLAILPERQLLGMKMDTQRFPQRRRTHAVCCCALERGAVCRACDSGVKSGLELETLCHRSRGGSVRGKRVRVSSVRRCGVGGSSEWAPTSAGQRASWWETLVEDDEDRGAAASPPHVSPCLPRLPLSLPLIGTAWSRDLSLYFSSFPSTAPAALCFLVGIDAQICVYTYARGTRQADSVAICRSRRSGCAAKEPLTLRCDQAMLEEEEGSGSQTVREAEVV